MLLLSILRHLHVRCGTVRLSSIQLGSNPAPFLFQLVDGHGQVARRLLPLWPEFISLCSPFRSIIVGFLRLPEAKALRRSNCTVQSVTSFMSGRALGLQGACRAHAEVALIQDAFKLVWKTTRARCSPSNLRLVSAIGDVLEDRQEITFGTRLQAKSLASWLAGCGLPS